MNLNDRFDRLDDFLKLDNIERRRAEAFHNRIGDILVAAGLAKRTRLQGSFARKTMRRPLKDIDKIIELGDRLREQLAGPDGPARAMAMIIDVLAPALPGSTFDPGKHALEITVEGETFTFDAVPAFSDDSTDSDWIQIADTEDRDWEPSSTYILIDTVATRNQVCEGRFVRQIRMMKEAAHHAGLGDVLPGLHIETFAYAAVTGPTAHPDAVAAILAAGAEMLGSAYDDPTGTDRISDRLSRSEVELAKSVLDALATKADHALKRARDGDEIGAARECAEIFGDGFPAPEPGDRSYLERLHRGAAVAGTSVAGAPTTRAWKR